MFTHFEAFFFISSLFPSKKIFSTFSLSRSFTVTFVLSTFNFLYKFYFVYPCKLLQKTIFFCFSFFTKKTRFCLFPFFFFVISLEIYFSCFVKCVRFKRAICHSVVHSNGQQPLRAGRSLFQSCGHEIVAGTLHCLEGGRAHESSSLEGLLQVRAGRSSPGACQERTGCWFVYTTAQLEKIRCFSSVSPFHFFRRRNIPSCFLLLPLFLFFRTNFFH